MAVFQDVDKCMRCNGCVISCKRKWKMKALNPGVHKTAPDQRVIIKSQKRLDMGPFIRFSCWHCPDPPCVKRCPFGALEKKADGAVAIDPTKCDPTQCSRQCVTDCQRGGYPKVGVGSDLFTTSKAWKCTLCNGVAGAAADLDPAYGDPNPTRATAAEIGLVAEKAHEPTCVYTCPAKAMQWDTRAAIVGAGGIIATGGYISYQGDGSMFWASKKYIIAAPKADPFVEDHITPMLSSMLTDSVSKATVVPTLVAGGIIAVIARRIRLANGEG
ncbi:MAG: hypothetical protein L6413_07945 [Coriobacteriia bacterium]|nr:hypothetical protein [Coriobacteriia bacterium]